MNQAGARWGNSFDHFEALYDWSIREPEKFWLSMWDFAGIIAETQGERVLIDGPVERLDGEVHHYTTESVAHRVKKNEDYATVAAEEMYRSGRRASLVQLLLVLPMSMLRDLVLKGGITSGVVYPRAISRLAKNYQIKGVGGTSAGAIAAAFAAAALACR